MEPLEIIKVIYQDDYFIAAYKPAGLLVHRTPIDEEDTHFLIQILRDQIGREVYPCHRLDKATSGLILLALDKETLRLANALFANGKVHKTYLALTRGWIVGDSKIDYPLRQELTVKAKQRKIPLISQSAITEYKTIEHFEVPLPLGRYQSARFSLCQLNPKTGRRHQLRRHLAHLRHPIIGDTTHGDGLQNRFFRDHFNCQRLMLTATHLFLKHPQTKKNLDLETLPDPSFSNVVNKLPKILNA